MDRVDRKWPRQVRMSEAEYRAAQADAKRAKLSFGEYVRDLLERARARRQVRR